MNCPNCDMPMPNHTYEGLFECLMELGKINQQLLEACIKLMGVCGGIPHGQSLDNGESDKVYCAMQIGKAAIAAAEGK